MDGIFGIIFSTQFLFSMLRISTPLVFAALLYITAFTTLGIGAIGLLERAVLKWRPSQRKR